MVMLLCVWVWSLWRVLIVFSITFNQCFPFIFGFVFVAMKRILLHCSCDALFIFHCCFFMEKD